MGGACSVGAQSAAAGAVLRERATSAATHQAHVSRSGAIGAVGAVGGTQH